MILNSLNTSPIYLSKKILVHMNAYRNRYQFLKFILINRNLYDYIYKYINIMYILLYKYTYILFITFNI